MIKKHKDINANACQAAGTRQQGTGVEFLYWVGGNVLELRVVMAVQLCDGTKATKLYISNT